ncbi:MAG: hypothetical protein AAB586_02415 [Patescibacteria group bacterium]
MQATTTLSISEIISLSQGLANTNLGYLGIAVTILVFLGGGTYFFSVKPFKDKIDKQEDDLKVLEKNVAENIRKAEDTLKDSLSNFKEAYSKELTNSINNRDEKLILKIESKSSELEKDLLEKINIISNQNNDKLKEILLSEMNNKILSLEKSLSVEIEKYKKLNDNELVSLKNKVDVGFRKSTSDIKELMAYKYDMEGKMGGIIFTIEALEDCLRDQPYLLSFKLNDLKAKIGKYTLSPELFVRLQKILKNIKGKEIEGKNYDKIITEIIDQTTVENKPKL